MNIPQISQNLQNAMKAEIAKLPPDMDAELGALTAIKAIYQRVCNSERNLVDTSNKGDMFLLTLAGLKN